MSTQSKDGLNKWRLESLTDGVFAIAMTLLVLDLKIPKVSRDLIASGSLAHALFGLWPKFLSYVMSFAVLGLYWIGHHGYSHFVKRSDRWYLWLNLFFLMFIVLIPFSTALLGDYHSEKAAVMVYGSNFVGMGIAFYLQWWYATRRHHLVGPGLEPEVIRMGKLRILRGIVLYMCAVLVALKSPQASLVLYVLIPVTYILPSKLDQHWTHVHD